MNRITLVAALFACSCAAPIMLSAGAGSVQVAEDTPEGCRFIGTMSKRLGANFRNLEVNMHDAEVAVRNQAAEAGATHLVLNQPETMRAGPDGSPCNNCTLVTGRAYSCDD